MTVEKTNHQMIISSGDRQGAWHFKVHLDGSQLQLETGIEEDWSGDEAFIDTSKSELRAIRDAINEVLGEK